MSPLSLFAPNVEQQIIVHDAVFINQKDAVLILGWLFEGQEKECIVYPILLVLYDKLQFPFASPSDVPVDLISGNHVTSLTEKRPHEFWCFAFRDTLTCLSYQCRSESLKGVFFVV